MKPLDPRSFVAVGELPYRRGVGIMLINRHGRVWTGKRTPKWLAGSAHCWQMPQGGLLRDEQPLAAALRELNEETGVRNVDVLGEIPQWLTYDLPEHLLGVALKGKYRGQRQRWFAMRFTGSDKEIDLETRGKRRAEFEDWRWSTPADLVASSVSFKRPIYAAVLAEFASHL